MFTKFELLGAGVMVVLLAMALFLVRLDDSMSDATTPQVAAVAESGLVVVQENANQRQAQTEALLEASDTRGNLERMVIDDITVGEGRMVAIGDTVSVHYAGRLQDGTEFDNSRLKGAPFEFTVGDGQVIAGWEEGLVGMQVGGERILVIPPEKGYGAQAVGPIPPSSTLVFSIELIAIE